MFNVTVLRLKDIIKYLVGIFITILLVVITTRYFSSQNQDKDVNKVNIFEKITSFFSKVPDEVLTSSVSTEIPITRYFEQNVESIDESSKDEKSIYEKILDSEIGTIASIEENSNLSEDDESSKVASTNEDKTETENLESSTTRRWCCRGKSR